MKTNPLVTIRCITYNHEPYIRECLEGFVMQQTNFKFEAVVHDDASTDGTAAIIAEFAEKYPDIIKPLYETENQYSKKDGSLDRIMNAHMRGKYIAMCEGDDYWTDPHKLQKQVDFLEANPEYGLCFTNVDRYREDDKTCVNNFFNESIRDEIASLEKYIVKGLWLATCTWVLRKDLYFQHAEWIGDKQFALGDLALAAFVLSEYKIAYLNDNTTVYRIHQGGVSNSKNDKVQYEFSVSCLMLSQYICNTLIDPNTHILAHIEKNYVQNQIKKILYYEAKKNGLRYLHLTKHVYLKGIKINTEFIVKHYALFSAFVKFEKFVNLLIHRL